MTDPSDVDPMKHAGEGFFSTEEYAKPDDIQDPYVRSDMANEGDYYPSAKTWKEQEEEKRRREAESWLENNLGDL